MATAKECNYPICEKGKQQDVKEKKSAGGEPLKIWSWNVSGLEGCVKKGGHELIRESGADIVSLQATKCSELPPEIMALDEYPFKRLLTSIYWGYAGVAMLAKEEPIKVEVGIGDAEFDEDARYIQAEYPEYFFIAIYVPNSGRAEQDVPHTELMNLDKRIRWDGILRNKLIALDKKKPVIIGGDMNVAHQEIANQILDLCNTETNLNKSGFTDQEREAFTNLIDAGFVDVWRTRNPNESGAYTYWPHHGIRTEKSIGWRLDYFVVSARIYGNVGECDILRDIRCSDHCPISMTINI